MKSIWWLLIIAMGIIFFVLGHFNWQVAKFKGFILIFFAIVGIALFVFWFFQRGKPHQ